MMSGISGLGASPPGKRKVVRPTIIRGQNRDTVVGSRVYRFGTNRTLARICPTIWMVPGARPIEMSCLVHHVVLAGFGMGEPVTPCQQGLVKCTSARATEGNHPQTADCRPQT
jgi:hypothetical protein